VDEQPFIVRGIYSTDTNSFDNFTVFLPLSKAQTIGQAENHASTILVTLEDMSQTDAVATAIQSPNYEVLTWMKMNDLLLATEEMANGYMGFFYLIVLGITATVVINTLIMSVFERTREIGILSAIGMKGRQIMTLFLAESSFLAVGGIIMGLVLGITAITIIGHYGFNISKMGLTGMIIGNTIYPLLTIEDTINLTIMAFVVTLLAGLYPAILAARMEPVEALRAEK
jgi:ABC-type lipoprotein release transport system permease subunit